ncbi:MAG: hypothetical protein SFW67_20845 [Myxococcaceae bacterium]|nr:hypothetical protein [Myxococcaceae bacterium]
MRRIIGWSAATWGVLGVSALLGSAIVRLWPLVREALDGWRSDAGFWVAVTVSLVFFGYTEGYRAFQRQLAPRVVARALTLVDTPSLVRGLLAPFFCMGYFGATRRRLITSWAVSLGIVGLVAAMKLVPQPWRGVVDLGVVFALGWGVLAVLAHFAAAVSGREPGVSPDLA